MKLTDEELRELYRKETARQARQPDDQCLASEMLTMAAAGELSVPERELAADHLQTGFDCAKEYRSIRTLKSWAAEATKEVPQAQVVGPTPFTAAIARPPADRGITFRSFVPYAIAALLL